MRRALLQGRCPPYLINCHGSHQPQESRQMRTLRLRQGQSPAQVTEPGNRDPGLGCSSGGVLHWGHPRWSTHLGDRGSSPYFCGPFREKICGEPKCWHLVSAALLSAVTLSFTVCFPTPSQDSAFLLRVKGRKEGWVICSKPLTRLVRATPHPCPHSREPGEGVEWERGVRRCVGVGGTKRTGLSRAVLA